MERTPAKPQADVKIMQCNQAKKASGEQLIPRTCMVCGLGPCKYADGSHYTAVSTYGKTTVLPQATMEELLAEADKIASAHREDTIDKLRAFYLSGVRVVVDHRVQDGNFAILVSAGDFARICKKD